MEEDNSLAPTSTSEIWPREAGNKLANIYEIVLIILKNLEFNDLLSCRQVCSLWREAAEKAMKFSIFIVKTKIEFSILRKSMLQPEVILPYLKLEGIENVQFVSEYPSYVPTEFLCATQSGFPVPLERIEEYSFDKHNISVSCEVLTQTAILPSIPGVEIHRLCYTPEEIHQCISNGRLNLAEKINVPQDKLKCVLWFFGDIDETRFLSLLRTPKSLFTINKYAMGGVERFCMTQLNRGIAFCGNRIKAVSLKLCRMTTKRLPAHAHRYMSCILHWKEFNFDQKKCIGFLFLSYDYEIGYTLPVLKSYFPDVPIFLRYCYWPFGNEYISDKDDTSDEDDEKKRNSYFEECPNKRHTECARLVLVWFI